MIKNFYDCFKNTFTNSSGNSSRKSSQIFVTVSFRNISIYLYIKPCRSSTRCFSMSFSRNSSMNLFINSSHNFPGILSDIHPEILSEYLQVYSKILQGFLKKFLVDSFWNFFENSSRKICLRIHECLRHFPWFFFIIFINLLGILLEILPKVPAEIL